jgi:hypothetical protein
MTKYTANIMEDSRREISPNIIQKIGTANTDAYTANAIFPMYFILNPSYINRMIVPKNIRLLKHLKNIIPEPTHDFFENIVEISSIIVHV